MPVDHVFVGIILPLAFMNVNMIHNVYACYDLWNVDASWPCLCRYHISIGIQETTGELVRTKAAAIHGNSDLTYLQPGIPQLSLFLMMWLEPLIIKLKI